MQFPSRLVRDLESACDRQCSTVESSQFHPPVLPTTISAEPCWLAGTLRLGHDLLGCDIRRRHIPSRSQGRNHLSQNHAIQAGKGAVVRRILKSYVEAVGATASPSVESHYFGNLFAAVSYLSSM
jgi:hypothetical protein